MNTQNDIETFVERMRQAAGDNVESIVLYGSAARDEHNEKYSDVNLLCLLRDVSPHALEAIAPVLRWWSQELRNRPPLFITTEELANSADVFAIETLDIKGSHRLLYGRDMLSAIDVPMNLHRVQLEHDLRTMLLKLRQHYMLAQGDDRQLEAALAKSVSSVAVLFRHSLIAAGIEPANGKRAVLAQAEQVFGTSVAAVNAALDMREGRRMETPVAAVYRAYMECIALVTDRIDQAAPKRNLQRVAHN